jgi:hypothetical protein
MMVWREDGERSLLSEVAVDDEAQIQEIVKDNPELLPVDELGIDGPLMVVGRETSLPSGAMDLVALARSGELLLIEFKTGPQNSDFRRVLAQLFDYGSDLWRMSYDEFESTVATRHFSSDHCRDHRLKDKSSLEDAARTFWNDFSEEESKVLRESLAQQLNSGAFYYVIVAQSFTSIMERTVEYMNAAMAGARIYAVELVRFTAEGVSAFESRRTIKPETSSTSQSRAESLNESRFLEKVADEEHREALRKILEGCRGLGLQLAWGSAGTSIRMRVPEVSKPVSVGWLYPPGVSGWMGLTDLTLGFDEGAGLQDSPSALSTFEDYAKKVSELPGAEPARPKWLYGRHLSPRATVENRPRIVEILANLTRQVSG